MKENIDYSKVAKQTLLKNIIGKAVYDINSRRATFKIAYYDSGIPYGYSKSRGVWGHLYPTYIVTDRGDFIPATRIYIE